MGAPPESGLADLTIPATRDELLPIEGAADGIGQEIRLTTDLLHQRMIRTVPVDEASREPERGQHSILSVSGRVSRAVVLGWG